MSWLRRAYDREAARYDERFLEQQAEKLRCLHARLPVPQGLTVDLGAGTGLLGRLTGRRTLQVDLSAAMLAFAVGPRIQADLCALPLPEGCAAAAFCVSALVGPADPAPALRSVARILAPGGWLALSLPAAVAPPDLGARLASAGFEILEAFEISQERAWIARRR